MYCCLKALSHPPTSFSSVDLWARKNKTNQGHNVLRSSRISRKSAALIVRYSQKKKWIFIVFYCSKNLQLLITLEPLDRFKWGFQQNVPLLMKTSMKQKTENVTRATSDRFLWIASHMFNTGCVTHSVYNEWILYMSIKPNSLLLYKTKTVNTVPNCILLS